MTNPPNTNRPFDDILGLIDTMPVLVEGAERQLCEEFSALGGALSPIGKFTRKLAKIAAWQDQPLPSLARPLIAVFSGTHGIAESLFDEDIIEGSKERVKSLTEGKAAVRGMAAELGAAFKVYEFGIEYPSKDFTKESSLSEKDCAAAIAFGMEVVAEGADVIVLGMQDLGPRQPRRQAHVLYSGGPLIIGRGVFLKLPKPVLPL